ncbi:MAG: DNA adenine methylase [Bacteroidetes bacterium]|nr:DNA adenine methylase [Bacteroidota bacterium]
MKYMGSKARFIKEILPIILKDKGLSQYYVEPFAGGMNSICEVDGFRIASDNNKYLIAMWVGYLDGINYPREISKSLYSLARDVFNGKETRFEHVMNMTDDLVGWIGFMASANGRFFEGGYSGISKTKIGTVRDYIAESIRNIDKQKEKMMDISLVCCDYRQLDIPKNSIIYCDIPYKGTKKYSTSKGFNYIAFWDWARKKSSQGHQVFISEYSAPSDFKCVWEKQTKSSLRANSVISGNKTSIERLFTIK